MRKVAIVGAGMTAFGEHFALGIKDLLPMAFAECAASVDKGLAKTDVQGAWFGAMGTADGFPSGILADSLGLPDLPVTRIENSCATGNDAVRNALFGVASGAFDVALVMGADKLRDTTSADMLWKWEAMTRDMAWDYPLGLVSPAGFALHVRRYIHESPATQEHLAMVAVKNHRHGVNNPKARLRFEITLEQALEAPTIVTPFRLYDCAPQSDGAAALVLAAEDVVDRFTDRPVWIRGVGLGLDSVMHQHKADMTTFPATTRAAKQAFAMAGMTPADVDVAEVHDFFTGIELISYEDLGFAERFGGYKLVEAEVTSVGGALPVNPSGGLKAKGHPPGATGVAQCVELFAQLRGEAANQVDGARVALAHNIDRRRFLPSPSWKDRPMARGSGAERWSAGLPQIRNFSGPMQAVGGLFAMSADAVRCIFRRPFQWREFLEQCWFIARVSLAPTLLVAIPFTVLVSFTLNILLRELGAADLSGAGAAFGAVTQVGPIVTVLIVAGAGATAMCADLGSRTIREEIDAMEVLGIDPVQRLVTPRMLAAGLVALLLNSLVVIIGILGGYTFSVFIQDVNPGAFAAGITLLTGVPEVIISCVKALLFGLIAGLVACYRGLTISGGGAKAVGNAVNETVVYAFMALFVINVVVTAIGIRMSAK